MRIQQKVPSSEKTHKWKTSSISQANRSEVVYFSAAPNAVLSKADFHLYGEYHVT